MKKLLTTISVGALTITSAYAQTTNQVNLSPIFSLLAQLQKLLTLLVPFAIGAAVIAFFWFLIVFIAKGGQDGDKRNASLAGMGWCIVAIFVMVSIWGLVGFLGSIFGIGQGGSVPVPGIPVPSA